MPFLQVNGITVPVAEWSRSLEDIGDSGRTFSGQRWSTRRAQKRSWQVTSTPVTRLEAEALTSLLTGQGDTWSFDVDLYSGKGNAMTEGTGIGIHQSISKYGAGALHLTGNDSTVQTSSQAIPHAGGRPYTLLAWLRSSLASGNLKVRAREYSADGALLATREALRVANNNGWYHRSGSWEAHPETATLQVQALIDGNPQGSAFIDDLVILPARLPAEMMVQARDFARPFPSAPRVLITGDMAGNETVVCEARVGSEGQQFARGGRWHNTGQTLDIELIEV